MNKRIFPPDGSPPSAPPKQTLSVIETAQVLGFEQTTIYRLIYRGELRVCAGSARYRITQAEIERFLGNTQTHVERVRIRPKKTGPKRAEKWRSGHSSAPMSLNAYMLFVPRALFGKRPVGKRLVRTIVPDDETLLPETLIGVYENEWALKPLIEAPETGPV